MTFREKTDEHLINLSIYNISLSKIIQDGDILKSIKALNARPKIIAYIMMKANQKKRTLEYFKEVRKTVRGRIDKRNQRVKCFDNLLRAKSHVDNSKLSRTETVLKNMLRTDTLGNRFPDYPKDLADYLLRRHILKKRGGKKSKDIDGLILKLLNKFKFIKLKDPDPAIDRESKTLLQQRRRTKKRRFYN